MYKLKKFLLYFILFFAFCLICVGIVKADTVENIGYDNGYAGEGYTYNDMRELISIYGDVFENARQYLIDTERATTTDVFFSDNIASTSVGINPNGFTIYKLEGNISLNYDSNSVLPSYMYYNFTFDTNHDVTYVGSNVNYGGGYNLAGAKYISLRYWFGGDENTSYTITNNSSGYSYVINTLNSSTLEYNVPMNMVDFIYNLNITSSTPTPNYCLTPVNLGYVQNYKQIVLKVAGTTNALNYPLQGYFDIIPANDVNNLDVDVFEITSIGNEDNLDMEHITVSYNLSVYNHLSLGNIFRFTYSISSDDDIDNFIEYMFFLKVDVTLPSITTNPTYTSLMEGTIIRSCTSRDILIDTSYGYKNSSGGTTSTDPVISNYLQDNNPVSDLNFLQKLRTAFPQGPVDSILNLPLVMLNSVKSSLESNCQPLVITLPYVNKNLTLNCQNTFYSNIGMTNFFNTVGTIASTVILMNYFIFLYNWVDDILKIGDTKVKMWGTGEVK